jgi:hypothetical protein
VTFLASRSPSAAPTTPGSSARCSASTIPTEIELLEFRRPRGELALDSRPQDVGVRVVTVIVDDVDAAAERLAEHGYPAKGAIVPFIGPDRDLRAVHVPGPGGIPLTLGQWIPHPSASA